MYNLSYDSRRFVLLSISRARKRYLADLSIGSSRAQGGTTRPRRLRLEIQFRTSGRGLRSIFIRRELSLWQIPCRDAREAGPPFRRKADDGYHVSDGLATDVSFLPLTRVNCRRYIIGQGRFASAAARGSSGRN